MVLSLYLEKPNDNSGYNNGFILVEVSIRVDSNPNKKGHARAWPFLLVNSRTSEHVGSQEEDCSCWSRQGGPYVDRGRQAGCEYLMLRLLQMSARISQADVLCVKVLDINPPENVLQPALGFGTESLDPLCLNKQA